MTAKSGYELTYSRAVGGYRVANMKGIHIGIVVPLADGQGWLILGDATHHAWATEHDAAEEILRQYEEQKSRG